MPLNNDQELLSHSDNNTRKHYNTPEVTVYGDLRAITAGGMIKGVDGVNSGNTSSTQV